MDFGDGILVLYIVCAKVKGVFQIIRVFVEKENDLSLAHNLHDKNKKSNDSTRVLKFNIARVVVCSHAGCFVSTFIIPRQFVHKFHLVRISRKTGSFRKYSQSVVLPPL